MYSTVEKIPRRNQLSDRYRFLTAQVTQLTGRQQAHLLELLLREYARHPDTLFWKMMRYFIRKMPAERQRDIVEINDVERALLLGLIFSAYERHPSSLFWPVAYDAVLGAERRTR